jgi:hypothetical protein
MPWHDRKPDPWYAIRTRKRTMSAAYRASVSSVGARVAAGFDNHAVIDLASQYR